MAVAKVIYKSSAEATPEVWMDTTQKTVDAGKLLSGETALKNDGTGVTGNIATKTSSNLTASGATVTAPAGYYASDASKSVSTATQATPSISVNSSTGVITASATQTAGYVSAGTKSATENLSTQAGATVSPTESEQTAVAAGKYTLGAVKVGAISSTYVGSGVTQNDSDDLTTSGATVTAPAGYYAEDATKTIASGTEGTPTATKGTVSNHSISVTPSVTNTAGYISGGTKTGTAVTVSASELVSGTKDITAVGTTDVTDYASVSVSSAQNITCPIQYRTDNPGKVTIYPTVGTAGWAGTGSLSSIGKVLANAITDLPTQAATTITPTTSSQTAVPQYTWTTGAVTVDPIRLTNLTVTPSTSAQIIVKDTDTGSVIDGNGNAEAHTAGTTLSLAYSFSPNYTPTVNASYRLLGQISIIDSSNNVLEQYNISSVFVWNTDYQTIMTNDDGEYIKTLEIKKISSESTAPFLRYTYGKTATYGFVIRLSLYTINTSYDGFDSVKVNPIPNQYIVPTGTKSITANGTGIDVAAYSTADVAVEANLAPAKSASPNANYDVPILPGTETLAAEFPTGVLPAWNVSSSNSGWMNAKTFDVVAGFVSGSTYFVTGEAYVRNYTTGAPIGTISIRGYWDATTSRSDLPVTFSSTGVSDVFDRVCAYFASSGAFNLQAHYLQSGRLQFTQPLRFYSLSNAYDGLVYGTANKPQLVNKVITGTTGGAQYVLPNTSTLVSSKTMSAITKNGDGVITSSIIVDSGVLTTGNMYRITFVAEYSKDDVSIGTINVNEDIYIDGSTSIFLNINREPDDGTIAINYLYYSQTNRYIYLYFAGTGSHKLTFLTPVNFYTMSGNNVGLSGVCVLPAPVPYSETLMKTYIERSASFTDITWPEGLTSIGNGAFAYCTKFNPSSLPSGITSISERAFYYCQELSITSLPSGITSIGIYAFYNCTKLALTSLPSGITSIGQYAFYMCKYLALTSLPSGLTALGSYAFDGCTNLALTSLPSGITAINAYTFDGCESLALTSLPNGVTSIQSNAFHACYSLTNITCSGRITTLNTNSFTGYSTSKFMQLASVSFPNMAVSSLSYAFGNTTAAYACQLLAVADIGSTQGIAANAFANCYALQTLVLRRTGSICTLANVSAFLNTPLSGYNSLTAEVYCPNDLISIYQTATNWSTLYNNGTITFKKIEGSDYDLS